MKIQITIAKGEYKVGEVLELPQRKAKQFIGAGFAETLSIPTPSVLLDAGIETIAEAQSMTDEEILSIPGIGKATLKKIRKSSS